MSDQEDFSSEVEIEEKNCCVQVWCALAPFIQSIINSLGRIYRIFITVGELYFIIMLFNFVLNYFLILLTSHASFKFGGTIICFIILSIYFWGFCNILLIVLWEFFQFRWIKSVKTESKEDKGKIYRICNPFKTFYNLLNQKDSYESLVWINFGVDSFFTLFLILHIIGLAKYSNNNLFDVMTIIMIIILPCIKYMLLLIFYMIRTVPAIFIKKEIPVEGSDPFIISLNSSTRCTFCDFECEPRESFTFIFNLVIYGYVLCYTIYICATYKLNHGKWIFPLFMVIISFLIGFPLNIPLKIFDYCKESYDCCKEYNYQDEEAKDEINKKYGEFFFLNLIVKGIAILLIIILVFTYLGSKSGTFQNLVDKMKDKWDGNPSGKFELHPNRGEVKNAMCFTKIHHMNIIQLASLAQMSYFNDPDKNIPYLQNSVFKGNDDEQLIIDNMDFLTDKDDDGVLLKADINIPFNERNVTVFSVRGSTTSIDWWLDLEMLISSALYSVARWLPVIQKLESLSSIWFTKCMTAPFSAMIDATQTKKYTDTLFKAYNKEIANEKYKNRDIVFVGHSLGGALSKIMGNKYEKQSVAFSGPGITPIEFMFRANDYKKYFKSTFIDIVPDGDIVPKVEVSGGVKYRLLCEENLAECHSIARSLCMLGVVCDEEYYTGDYCKAFFTDDDIGKMKRIKNMKF